MGNAEALHLILTTPSSPETSEPQIQALRVLRNSVIGHRQRKIQLLQEPIIKRIHIIIEDQCTSMNVAAEAIILLGSLAFSDSPSLPSLITTPTILKPLFFLLTRVSPLPLLLATLRTLKNLAHPAMPISLSVHQARMLINFLYPIPDEPISSSLPIASQCAGLIHRLVTRSILARLLVSPAASPAKGKTLFIGLYNLIGSGYTRPRLLALDALSNLAIHASIADQIVCDDKNESGKCGIDINPLPLPSSLPYQECLICPSPFSYYPP